MKKRTIKLGAYDTATYGWTLTGWKLSAPEQKTKYQEKANGDGSWDLSTALTDGIAKYKDRTLTVTLELSEGDRGSRTNVIRHMVNTLDGARLNIVLPDDLGYHLVGRVHVAIDYNDLAHAAVTVTATCEPWKYADEETIVTLTAKTDEQTAVLTNRGRRAVVPVIKVTGTNASVLLKYGTASKSTTGTTFEWPELLLTPGDHQLKYSGSGTITITYREAVLE